MILTAIKSKDQWELMTHKNQTDADAWIDLHPGEVRYGTANSSQQAELWFTQFHPPIEPKPIETADLIWKSWSLSTPGTFHTVRLYKSGGDFGEPLYTCNCKGYQVRKFCRHIQQILEVQNFFGLNQKRE